MQFSGFVLFFSHSCSQCSACRCGAHAWHISCADPRATAHSSLRAAHRTRPPHRGRRRHHRADSGRSRPPPILLVLRDRISERPRPRPPHRRVVHALRHRSDSSHLHLPILVPVAPEDDRITARPRLRPPQVRHQLRSTPRRAHRKHQKSNSTRSSNTHLMHTCFFNSLQIRAPAGAPATRFVHETEPLISRPRHQRLSSCFDRTIRH